MKSLTIRDLDVCYGSFTAVQRVSLEVQRGEFIALLGPSGCGKTSLLRAIAGFVSPSAGLIRIGDSDVSKIPSRARNIGIVFQSYALFPHMTVLENVAFGLECRQIGKALSKDRALESLAMVGLSAFENRKPRQLSGGQQQRVALARALVIQPDILLLDEPLGALDRKLRLQMQVELKALQARLGVTTVMVTHDQEEAMVLADRIAVMRDGVIEQIGTPEALFSKPRTPWIADFMGAGSTLKGRIHDGPEGRTVSVSDVLTFRLNGQATQFLPSDVTLFLRADEIQLEKAPQNRGLQVVAKRYLGFSTEIEASRGDITLRALLPTPKSEGMEIGSWVTPSIENQDPHVLQTQ